MKKQEIFDKAAAHLLTQMERAESDAGCQYRTKSGLKCAIGCLIPDDLYDERIEELDASSFVIAPTYDNERQRLCRRIGRKIGLRKNHNELLCVLQNLHDDISPENWEAGLVEIAKEHDLKAPA